MTGSSNIAEFGVDDKTIPKLDFDHDVREKLKYKEKKMKLYADESHSSEIRDRIINRKKYKKTYLII